MFFFLTLEAPRWSCQLGNCCLALVFHQELISQSGLEAVQDPSHEERLRQYSKVSLKDELMEKGWCNLVPQLLQSTEHDYREKVG